MSIITVTATSIMVLAFSFIVDSQMELRPEIISLILRKIYRKNMAVAGWIILPMR